LHWKKVNVARRHFVSYIFHEIRVPFQAVNLGISELEMVVGDLVEQCQQSLSSNANFNSNWTSNTTKHSGIVGDMKEAAIAVETILDNVRDQSFYCCVTLC
jgi:hypothetical protein